jgi:hypothetical protein
MEKSGRSVVCIQETKLGVFFIKSPLDPSAPKVLIILHFLHRWELLVEFLFSKLFCVPSSSIEVQSLIIIVNFQSAHSDQYLTLVCFYGPCEGGLRDIFTPWLFNLLIPHDELWLVTIQLKCVWW